MVLTNLLLRVVWYLRTSYDCVHKKKYSAVKDSLIEVEVEVKIRCLLSELVPEITRLSHHLFSDVSSVPPPIPPSKRAISHRTHHPRSRYDTIVIRVGGSRSNSPVVDNRQPNAQLHAHGHRVSRNAF